MKIYVQKGLMEGLARLIRKKEIVKGRNGKLTPKTPAGVRQIKNSSKRRHAGHDIVDTAIGKETTSPNLRGTPEQMLSVNRARHGEVHSQDSKGNATGDGPSYKSQRGVKKVKGSKLSVPYVKQGEPSDPKRHYRAIGGKYDRNSKLSAYKMNRHRGFSKKQSVGGTHFSRPGGFGSAPGRYKAIKPKESGFKKMLARSTKDK